MSRIALKINNIPCVLPADTQIHIQEETPVFSDSGSFSYPIEMSISANRELFQSLDSADGVLQIGELDKLPFQLWYDGMLLLSGQTEMEDSLDVDGDSVSVNLISGNADFRKRTEELKCNEVPLLNKIKVGTVCSKLVLNVGTAPRTENREYLMDEDYTMDPCDINVSDPYPLHAFCNARICVPRSDDYDVFKDSPYWVYEADRPWSGICFYVPYFMDCLFAHLNLSVEKNDLLKVEDFCRLAFFNTRCKTENGNDRLQDTWNPLSENANIYYLVMSRIKVNSHKFQVHDVYATKENFPDVEVHKVFDSLFNALGVKVISNEEDGSLQLIYIRDILRRSEVTPLHMQVLEHSLNYNKVSGVCMSYGGDEKDTAFSYHDWKRILVRSEFKQVPVSAYDKSLYIVQNTGNKYRIKISKKAEEDGKKGKELFPSLFEVAQYNDYVYGQKAEDNETLDIEFSPLISNDVAPIAHPSRSGSGNRHSGGEPRPGTGNKPKVYESRLAVLVDTEQMKAPIKAEGKWSEQEDFLEKVPQHNVYQEETGNWHNIAVGYNRLQNYDKESCDESPLQAYDAGFTLGVMRGPGSQSKVEVVLENYDGNGNNAWTTVVADYAFSADSIDAYGNQYDYNGTAPGGVDPEGRISLKLHVEEADDVDKDVEPKDWGINATAAKRGLADRFMSEYLYFLKNRKTATFQVETSLAEVRALKWDCRYRLHQAVGYLKSRSYVLTEEGIKDVEIQFYTLN